MTDFVSLLEEHDIPYKQHGQHHHTTANHINIDCPLCSPDSGKYRLGYSLLHHYCSCWVCGYVHPSKVIYELTGQYLPVAHTRKVRESIPTGRYQPPDHLTDLLPCHRRYLRQRGFNPDVITDLWGIRGIGKQSRTLKWRIWIPIHYQGREVSWTTRSISDHGTRYKTARHEQESIHHKHLLYGWDHVRGNTVIVHEGPLDVWSTGPGAVATFGLVWSEQQLELLSRIPLRVICFDAEEKAQRRARKLCRSLMSFPGETLQVQLESGKDSASADRKEIAELREQFLPEYQ